MISSDQVTEAEGAIVVADKLAPPLSSKVEILDHSVKGESSVHEIMAAVGRQMSSETRQVLFVKGRIQFSDVEADK